jgi:hypothetical protein
MNAFKVLAALVCDDVRREDNGKEIIIGLYSADIRLPGFPANMRLVFWMQVLVETTEQAKFQFRVMGPNEAQLVTADVVLESSPPAGTVGSIPLVVPIQIQSVGILRLELRDGPESEWEEVKRISVAQTVISG